MKDRYIFGERRDWRCIDCGGDAVDCIDFMINDALWKRFAGPDSKKIICALCFETRLGRPLTQWDLKDVPTNRPILFGMNRR